MRDYLRMYEDAKGDLKKIKQRLLHFLLRRGLSYIEGTNWTEKHKRWIRCLEMEHPIDGETLCEYLSHIADSEERCQRIASRIEEISEKDNWGIHLTGVSTRCSIAPHGGLSAQLV